MENKLPKNWNVVPFTTILNIEGGTQPPKSTFIDFPTEGYVRLLQIRDFGNKPIPTYIPKTSKLRTCKKNDILIARYGASIGRILYGMEGAYNVALAKVIIPDEINTHFIKYLLSSQIFQNPILSLQRTAQSGFNKNDLKNIEIPLPPRAEQNRIVAKLDALFARHETIKKSLEKIPLLLKNFKQQVLTQAVTGKLTEEWRMGRDVGEWVKELAKECCEKVQSGGTPRGSKFQDSGIPFFKVYNIVNQMISFDYRPQYISDEINITQCKKSICLPGDVLMNIVGPPLNKVAIIPQEYERSNINQAITLFRPKEKLQNKYLYYFLREGTPVNNLINETRGVVGQVNISLTQCREIEINIPPLKEQEEIVNRVESLFAKVAAIEQKHKSLKSKVENLPQSILHKAFKGELVKQLPTDGDARNLLKEIEGLKKQVKNKKQPTRKKKVVKK
ncbi:restriction endonuclease subunit S [Joostella atrarenae]|uniref:Restriction endonuclease subunit S n=1 Tax=Joostella atrarenae TaxID=679257 RepID=A0ABS9J7P8_9FLAO|nr:restriction endonuclease subunit S [Joostella atrarenae]MCF8716456.1 restriction endonuclease subunit S [Joostella atrarenae]